MPNEPDNKMDDLLKAYAQKRKADAGEPLELHPATRRLLQAEAAKLRPRPAPEFRSWFSLIMARWPGIALAVGLFVLLGIGVRLMLPMGEHSDRQMFAKQGAPVDRLETTGKRAKKEVQELKDAAASSSKLSREEGAVTRAGEAVKSVELAVADAQKPRDDMDKELSAAPPAASPPLPPPGRFFRSEAALDAGPVNSPARRELEVGQAANPAPVSAPTVRRSQQVATVTGESREFFSLGTFTNSSQLPEVSLQFASQAVGGTRGVERKQVEPRPSALSEFQTPVPAPVQEPPVALAKAKQDESVRSDNYASNLSQTQTAKAQTIQTPEALNLGVAKSIDRQSRILGAEGVALEARGNAGVAPQASRPEQNSRYVVSSGSLGILQPAVLTSFSLQQRGDRVRVLDRDGSIYEGTVLAMDGAAGAPLGRALDGLQTQGDARAKAAGRKGQGSGGAGSRVVNFRVAGTNRTLNLPVILEGSLFAGVTDQSAATANRDGQRPSAVNRPADVATVLAVDRIVGRARIGATNEVRIDAMRTRN